MRTYLCVAVMLMVAPLIAATTLVYCSPERWGSSLNPINIACAAFLGVFSTVIWPTYIPALFFTPMLMRRVSQHPRFTAVPISWLLGLSLVIGAAAGVCVLAPIVFLSMSDSSALTFGWVSAGAVSGALTLAVICLIYRYVRS